MAMVFADLRDTVLLFWLGHTTESASTLSQVDDHYVWGNLYVVANSTPATWLCSCCPIWRLKQSGL